MLQADIQGMRDAICSAADVMRAMASSICSLLEKVTIFVILSSDFIHKNEFALQWPASVVADYNILSFCMPWYWPQEIVA